MSFNNILITGGSGFIGSYLSKELTKCGFNVTILDKISKNINNLPSIQADIRNYNELEKINKSFDLVIHLAAEHQDNIQPTSKYYDINVEGTKNILKFCNLNNIKNFIFFSTQAVYGDDKEKYTETDIPKPSNHYGKSKYLAEKLLLDWKKDDYKLAIIRPSAVFGDGSIGNFSRLINQIKSNKFIMIGDGSNIKSVCYVKNLIEYVKHCMKLLESRDLLITNYADKPDIQINNLVDLIRSIINSKPSKIKISYSIAMLIGYIFDFLGFIRLKPMNITSLRIKKFCSNSILESSIIESTGFAPTFSFREALEDSLEEK